MPSKLQYFQSVADQAAQDVAASRSNWTDFLDTSARLYKYTFPDQLLIHNQRPDAIACAPIETWNETFNRWVRRGAKGIALIDDTGNYPRLKYVFDVNDTETALYNSRPVYLWEMHQEHRELVLEALDKIYDDVGDSIAESFHNIASQLAREYYGDNAREIRFRAEGSFLEELDDYNFGLSFENALTNSIAYTLMSRCGFDTADHFEDDDFRYIHDFNTPDMVYALGTAANELSAQVLRDIEIVIKKHERQKTAERSATHERSDNIQPSRGLSPTGHQTGRAAEGTGGSVGPLRENEESLSERPSDDNLQSNVAERNPVSAPAGDTGSSHRETGAINANPNGAEPTAGQGDRPDGLGGGDEHHESASQRNGAERTDLRRLNETAPPTEISTTPISETISTSSITLDEVDSILRDGGNDNNSVLRITAHFAKGLSHEDNAEFLRREYLMGRWGRDETPGGKGYQFGAEQTALWFDENGLTIGRGKSAIFSNDSVVITWEQAADRVKQLYESGQYVNHDVLDEALYNESKERADDVVEVYKNMSRGIHDLQWELRKHMTDEQKAATENDWRINRYLISGLAELAQEVDEAINGEPPITPDEAMRLYNKTIELSEEIPQEWGFDKSHPEVDEQVTSLLHQKGPFSEREVISNAGFSETSDYAKILNRFGNDVAELQNAPDAPIRFWRNPHRALANLIKAGIEPKGFPVAEINSLNHMRFITDDEVDKYLTRGSNYHEGKLRILSHFMHDHTPKERTDFIKREYGHGGGTWIDGWSNAEPGKGVRLQRPGCDDVNLNWNQVIRRTQALIESGRYASRAELDYIPQYERIMLARAVKNFFHDLPQEYERPFDKTLDFNYSTFY